MALWEYAAIVVKSDSEILWMSAAGTKKMTVANPIAALNEAGRLGWEAITAETPSRGSAFWGYGDIVYTLKKPLPR